MRSLGTIRHLIGSAAVVLVAWASAGCSDQVPPRIVVYTSLDQEVAQPIFADFTKATGIKINATYGKSSACSTDLTQEIVAQRESPRCDLVWNQDILETLSLDRDRLLRPFAPPAASQFPASERSPEDIWYSITLVARVLVINVNQIAEARQPKSIKDLTDPQWYERTAIAKPLDGPSAVHAACIFAALGDAKAQEFYRAVKRTARILADDREVAHEVATGRLAFGLTNSSDAAIEIAAGAPIKIVYPDQDEGQLGTLFVPSTVALVKNSPNPAPAEQLFEYLLSAEVAERLAGGTSAMIPTRIGVTASNRVKTPTDVRAMPADFAAAADHWNAIAKILQADFPAGD